MWLTLTNSIFEDCKGLAALTGCEISKNGAERVNIQCAIGTADTAFRAGWETSTAGIFSGVLIS
jgi:hypothetical protein